MPRWIEVSIGFILFYSTLFITAFGGVTDVIFG